MSSLGFFARRNNNVKAHHENTTDLSTEIMKLLNRYFPRPDMTVIVILTTVLWKNIYLNVCVLVPLRASRVATSYVNSEIYCRL